jgi:hypothetical protein
MAKIEYSSNNSGGGWWLTDENWRDLERAGWLVEWGGKWFCKSPYTSLRTDQKPAYLTVECETVNSCNGHQVYLNYEEAAASAAAGTRWLGALATRATREGLSEKDAIAEWENITGCCAEDTGCPCCGSPHYFSEED